MPCLWGAGFTGAKAAFTLRNTKTSVLSSEQGFGTEPVSYGLNLR